jgi:CheY-like chemotaxis protein
VLAVFDRCAWTFEKRCTILAMMGEVPRLLVFLHAAVKQRAFQAELQKALANISVTSVGRPSDFERAREAGQDALLTHPVVLEAYGIKPRLHGFRVGRSAEPYSLVGVGSVPRPATVPSVGALDILGREGTETFVQHLLGARASVERVTKVEDLLALLQMQRVRSVVLPTRLFPELAKASRLPLVEVELSLQVELPALAVVGPFGAQVLSAITKLSGQLADILGVDQWLP